MDYLGHWCPCSYFDGHFLLTTTYKYERITHFEFLNLDEEKDNITVSYHDQCNDITDRSVSIEELTGWWKEKGCGDCVSMKVAVRPVDKM